MRSSVRAMAELRGMIAAAPQIDEARFRRLLIRAARNLADPFMASHMIAEVHETLLTAKQCGVDDTGHDYWQDVADGVDELETAARAAV